MEPPSSDNSTALSTVPIPRYEELEAAFNGLFERNPWAFALQHHARVSENAEAVIWLNGEVSTIWQTKLVNKMY